MAIMAISRVPLFAALLSTSSTYMSENAGSVSVVGSVTVVGRSVVVGGVVVVGGGVGGGGVVGSGVVVGGSVSVGSGGGYCNISLRYARDKPVCIHCGNALITCRERNFVI